MARLRHVRNQAQRWRDGAAGAFISASPYSANTNASATPDNADDSSLNIHIGPCRTIDCSGALITKGNASQFIIMCSDCGVVWLPSSWTRLSELLGIQNDLSAFPILAPQDHESELLA